MVVADHLYRNHPDLPEGERDRPGGLVCEDSLVEVAEALHLGEYLHLGKEGGRRRPKRPSHPGGDAVEVLAAVSSDGGIGSARKIVQQYIPSAREVGG